MTIQSSDAPGRTLNLLIKTLVGYYSINRASGRGAAAPRAAGVRFVDILI